MNESQLRWGETLHTLAPGVSIATLVLVPEGRRVAASGGAFVHQLGAQPITCAADGPMDPRVAFRRTAYGVGRLDGERETTMPALMPAISIPDTGEMARDARTLPLDVRTESELPVETLARLVGVSRMRYHEWLRGAGISEENARRLGELLDVFRTVRALRGDGFRTFLETAAAGGQPLALLEGGDDAAVIGLAMRTPVATAAAPLVSEAARHSSGVPGWLRPARRLAWESPGRTEEEQADMRARLSPRATSEEKDRRDAQGQDSAQVLLASALFVE